MNKIDRRQLLKALSVTLGAGIVMPGFSLSTDEITRENELHFTSDITLDKPVTAITLGAGSRGNVYGNYALKYPGNLDIVGVAEPIKVRNDRYAKKHQIDDKYRFDTWERVFERPKFADAIITSTPDNLHYAPCMKALEMGYDILLEKPISPSERECRDILRLAKKTGRIVAVCHVLRYAPYFIKLRDLIQSGLLGKVVSVQHIEPIHHIHMSHSYVRGNWHNSKATTPIILAKSCHDLDILRWMLGKPAKAIQAFGDLSWFRKENAPEGSTARCTDGCKVEGSCPYSAIQIYYRKRTWTYVFDFPDNKDEHAEFIMNQIKTTNYGRCVYRMDNDQPDHYTTNILFEDNVTASFSMEAFTSYEGRRTRIMGTLGDVVGDMTSMIHTDFLTGKKTEWKQESDGHGGGDWQLVNDWLLAISKKDPSLLTSTIDQSIESHVMGFMAEESRKHKRVMDVKM
jgi:Oxidoreductase family, NAD-binding Rossmann fold/Oxidoreductase family, C-terminal alpha/beta domain